MTRALALSSLLLSTVVHAADEMVVLTTRGPPDECAAVEASLGELLHRLRLTVVSEARSGALAFVLVELGPTAGTISLSDSEGKQVGLRRVPRSPSSPAVTVEAVAYVAQSMVEALTQTERAPRTPRVPTTPFVAQAHPEPAAVTAPVGVELGVFVGGRTFGDTAPFVLGGGALASLRVERPGAWAPRVSLLVAYNGPFSAQSSLVQLSTQSLSVRGLVGVRVSVGRLAFDGQLGAGFDSLFTHTQSTSLPADLLRDRHDASPTVSALVAARLLLTPTTELFLAATVDVDLLPRRFVTVVLGERAVLFETWRVRPALLLGFSFDLLGGRRAP